MRTRIVSVLTALVLTTGIGVATATAAHADTVMGPFNTIGACEQSRTAYRNAGYSPMACQWNYVSGNTYKWFYRVLIHY